MSTTIFSSGPEDESIQKAISNCQLCDNLGAGPNPIFQLSSQAKILIAGQAPGLKTHQRNKPFDDASGQRLREWLGVDESTFYNDQLFAILPMAFCYPGTGKSGDLPPPKICAETWREQALTQLTHIELTVVIGKYAIDWHLPQYRKSPITEIVKNQNISALNSADKNASVNVSDTIVLPHPSPRNNIWLKKNPWFSQEVLPALKNKVHSVL